MIYGLALHPFEDRSGGETYTEGDIVEPANEDQAERWEREGLIKIISMDGELSGSWPWDTFEGKRLEVVSDRTGKWDRVVACLNIWQDLPDLHATYETWYPHVDHVIAVDGAYEGVPAEAPFSTDGTLEFLEELEKVELVRTQSYWPSQVAKRNEYFARLQPGDLAFVVDADERVYGAEALRDLPHFHVGWVRYLNPIYERPQGFPRLFDGSMPLEYRGRHHWIFREGRLLTTCQKAGLGYEHRRVPITVENSRGISRGPKRIQAAKMHRVRQAHEERSIGTEQTGGWESLRIVQLTSLDPGMVVYRLHSAINEYTPHESIMGSTRHDRPYEEPFQYDLKEDRAILREAIARADVVHCHLSYHQLDQLGVPCDTATVIHHHGTMYREASGARNVQDERRAGLQLISNLELTKYGNAFWLPNPIPVRRYLEPACESRPLWGSRPFRIAHSPSKRDLKGTELFLEAVEVLRGSYGLDVEAVLIEGATHRESILRKATCHAMFDSFWLGIQCSGLEAAAMQMPVIAGDSYVAQKYREYTRDVADSPYEEYAGQCPYTFADMKHELVDTIHRLVTGEDYYWQEAARVYSYVLAFHDYAAVTRRYLERLDGAFDWKRKMSLGNFEGRLHT